MKEFFTKTVAGMPVWSFFAIGLAILLVVIITAVSASKKKNKESADENAETVTDVATQQATPVAEGDINAVAEVNAEIIDEKAKANDVKAEKATAKEVEAEPVIEEIKTEPVIEEKKDEKTDVVSADIAVEKKTTKKATTKTSTSTTKTSTTTKPKAEKEETAKPAPVSAEKADEAKPAVKKAPAKATTAKATTAKATPAKTAEKAPAKANGTKPVAKKVVKIETDEESKGGGKFQIIFDKNNEIKPYKFCLVANNGKVLFESESYKVKPTMRSINAFKRHCKEGSFSIDADKNDNYRYKLYSSADALVGVGEGYTSKTVCENAIESVKKFAASASVLEDLTTELF